MAPDAGDAGDAGFGALKTAAGLLPLKALEIEAHLHGPAAGTTLRQTFVNASPAARGLSAHVTLSERQRAASSCFGTRPDEVRKEAGQISM
ncbi:MAG TPA: hypothetical protein VJX71_21345 [Methylomirabilota bacterium]|nr:hypothetical protein [Methylomirabilota bacterium]